MNRPRVFISAVTGELRGARRRVAEILTRKGYEPVTQDIWGTEPGDLRPMLRGQIENCHGLIQIVGDAYGAEPPAPDAEFGRCSYTQYEFLLARQLGKKTWLLIAGLDCARDASPAQLDLPADPAHPDPAQAARDVSAILDRLGHVLIERGQAGDAEQALGYYTRSLDLREALLKANPASAQAARFVSWSLERLGGFLVKRGQPGDAEAALAHFTRYNEISEALLKANPGSAQAARNVSLSCYKLAKHTERTGKGDAMQWWRRAYDILAGMKEKGQFISSGDLKILEELRRKVGQ